MATTPCSPPPMSRRAGPVARSSHPWGARSSAPSVAGLCPGLFPASSWQKNLFQTAPSPLAPGSGSSRFGGTRRCSCPGKRTLWVSLCRATGKSSCCASRGSDFPWSRGSPAPTSSTLPLCTLFPCTGRRRRVWVRGSCERGKRPGARGVAGLAAVRGVASTSDPSRVACLSSPNSVHPPPLLTPPTHFASWGCFQSSGTPRAWT